MAVSHQDLGRAVKQLQYRHHREIDRHLRQTGSSLAQWDALRAISRKPSSSAHALAEATFQTDQSFGALAARMVRAGLIQRIPGPGRAIRHRLTPAGEAALRRGQEVASQVLRASFAPLSTGQRDQLFELVARALREGRPAQEVGL